MHRSLLVYKDGKWYLRQNNGELLPEAYELAEDAIEAMMMAAEQEDPEDAIKTEEFSEDEIAFIDILGSMVRTDILDY